MPAAPHPSVHVLSSDPVRLNSTLVTGAETALLIDTGAGPAHAARILAAVRTLTDLPLIVANTHDHWDHFFGNALFAESGVTEFLASPAFVRDCAGSAWLQHAEASEYELALPAPEHLLVDMTAVQDGDTLDLGGGEAEFLVLSGHTDTDLAVRVGPVVITGDLLEEGAPPAIGAEATPVAWTRSLARLLALPGADVFVPGHGRPVGRAFVQTQLTDLAAFAADETEETELPARFAADPPHGEAPGHAEGGASGRTSFGVRITRVV
ncbi:MBL fold metallo-hydrolase [Brevibacterium album]|uniref:MBL fold metallo-hydrolase n=1 Tax=Brevibacterium album TaxID=417948 RepID=UPI000405CBBF|nr:MBL fold metallo-hydrolase [Brevibacterium album]